MSLLDLIGTGSGDAGMSKTAHEQQADLQAKGESMYKVGCNMAWNHIKQAAEEATGGEGKESKKEDEKSSDERVKARTKEIYEKLKEEKKD